MGIFKSTIALERLNKTLRKATAPTQKSHTVTAVDTSRSRQLNFKQELDVRGMRADEALQALNNKINIVVFDKDNVIYASMWKITLPINNYKITQAMEENNIDEVALNDAILELYPHANLSVNQQEGLAIAIVTSMGHDADTVVFDYLWKIICN